MKGFIEVRKSVDEIVLVNIDCIAAVEPFPTTDEEWGDGHVVKRGENGSTILMTSCSGLEDLLTYESYPVVLEMLEEATA